MLLGVGHGTCRERSGDAAGCRYKDDEERTSIASRPISQITPITGTKHERIIDEGLLDFFRYDPMFGNVRDIAVGVIFVIPLKTSNAHT